MAQLTLMTLFISNLRFDEVWLGPISNAARIKLHYRLVRTMGQQSAANICKVAIRGEEIPYSTSQIKSR